MYYVTLPVHAFVASIATSALASSMATILILHKLRNFNMFDFSNCDESDPKSPKEHMPLESTESVRLISCSEGWEGVCHTSVATEISESATDSPQEGTNSLTAPHSSSSVSHHISPPLTMAVSSYTPIHSKKIKTAHDEPNVTSQRRPSKISFDKTSCDNGIGAVGSYYGRRSSARGIRRNSVLRDSMLGSIRDSMDDNVPTDETSLDADDENDHEDADEQLFGRTLESGLGYVNSRVPLDMNLMRKNSIFSADSERSNGTDSFSDTENCHKRVKRRSWSSGYFSVKDQDLLFEGEGEFEESVVSKVSTLEESLRLLRRTRAIFALANRLMAAPDEKACLEEVARLMVIMFDVDRVSFALVSGADNYQLIRLWAKKSAVKESVSDIKEANGVWLRPESQQRSWRTQYERSASDDAGTPYSSFDLEYLESDTKRPFAGSAVGYCAQTLKEYYSPRTAESPFPPHRVLAAHGFDSTLATPIIVNGNKFAGCILTPKAGVDAFKKPDRVLIQDIAALLAANIYSKRLRKQTEESHKMTREMLHSFIPPKVLGKIEGYWDSKSRKAVENLGSMPTEVERSTSWYVANADWSEADAEKAEKESRNKRNEIQGKINLIRNMEGNQDDVGVLVHGEEWVGALSPTSRALYAENVKSVCIIFTDIVGFSRICLDLEPIGVMNMLQDLFGRFDSLCDVHNVMKLETIGDAYICATNLLEDDACYENARNAAIRALAMAKDMILVTRNARIPYKNAPPTGSYEALQIRVGIHVGDITCGVLGQRLPKFTTFGTCESMSDIFAMHCLLTTLSNYVLFFLFF